MRREIDLTESERPDLEEKELEELAEKVDLDKIGEEEVKEEC